MINTWLWMIQLLHSFNRRLRYLKDSALKNDGENKTNINSSVSSRCSFTRTWMSFLPTTTRWRSSTPPFTVLLKILHLQSLSWHLYLSLSGHDCAFTQLISRTKESSLQMYYTSKVSCKIHSVQLWHEGRDFSSKGRSR